MPTEYEAVCKAFNGNRERDKKFDENCRNLAQAFRRGLIGLGWSEQNLKWVPWTGEFDPDDNTRYELRKVMVTLHDEGCQGVRLMVGGSADEGWFAFHPELRLRYYTGTLELLVGERAFTGGDNDHERLGKEAAEYYVGRMKAFMEEEPEKWMQTVRPKGSKKALGFEIK